MNAPKEKHSNRLLVQLGSSMPLNNPVKSISKLKQDHRPTLVVHRVNLSICPHQTQNENMVEKQSLRKVFQPNPKSLNMKMKFNLAQERIRQVKEIEIRQFDPFKNWSPTQMKAEQQISVHRLHKLVLPPVPKINSMPKSNPNYAVQITPKKLLHQKYSPQNNKIPQQIESVTSKLEPDKLVTKIEKQQQKQKEAGKKKAGRKVVSILKLIKYRIRAQNYSLMEIKQRITKLPEDSNMEGSVLEREPFFLNPSQARTLIDYLEEEQVQPLSREAIIDRIGRLVGKCKPTSPQVKAQALFELAVVMSSDGQLVEGVRKSGGRMSREQLGRMLGIVQMERSQVQIIIGQVCLWSDSLQQLDYGLLLDRLW